MKRQNPGDSIDGDKIAVQTRKCSKPVQVIFPGGRSQKSYKFSTHAYCVVETPLKKSDSPTASEHSPVDDSIEGAIISGRADDNSPIQVVRATHTHRTQRLRLLKDAYCVIDVPLRRLQGQ